MVVVKSEYDGNEGEFHKKNGRTSPSTNRRFLYGKGEGKIIGTRLVLDGNLFFNLTSVPFPTESFQEVSDSAVLLGIASQG